MAGTSSFVGATVDGGPGSTIPAPQTVWYNYSIQGNPVNLEGFEPSIPSTQSLISGRLDRILPIYRDQNFYKINISYTFYLQFLQVCSKVKEN